MNSNQRKEIRTSLINAGLRRVGFSEDCGDGVYEEHWLSPGGDEVILNWAPKTS